jgi:hypothetical protein
MSYKTCAKCGANDLIWAQSKKGNWYLAVEKRWIGDNGAIRVYLPAHICATIDDEENCDSFSYISRSFDSGYYRH